MRALGVVRKPSVATDLVVRPAHSLKDPTVRRAVQRKYGVTVPSPEIRRLGDKKSSRRCRVCQRKISMLAAKFNDPYCSRVCMSKDRGISMKTARELLEDPRFRNQVLLPGQRRRTP